MQAEKIACPNVTRYLTLKKLFIYKKKKKKKLCNIFICASKQVMDDDEIKANLSEKLPPIEIDKLGNWNWPKINSVPVALCIVIFVIFLTNILSIINNPQ